MIPLVETTLIDWTDCPFVEINPRKVRGTHILKGTRMPADGITENYMDGMTSEEIAEVFEISEDGVHSLLLFASVQNPAIKL